MEVHQLSRVFHNLRTTTPHDDSNVSDGQLLGQFIDLQDESAFAALVQRHSPMVWGVCRRVVGHHQDAEDAFQAAFLVLARKANSIRPREMVASWLFGVAHRTALKARSLAAKRHTREQQVLAMPEPEAIEQASWENLELLIDQELANLPDKYRIAIVLCDLEGKTGKSVARQLKIPEGTLSTRLRTARVMLAKRLVRQGITLSGGALAAALAQNARAAHPPSMMLVSSTIKAAIQAAAGKTAAAWVISAQAAALTEGVLKAMLLTKLKTVMAVMLVLGLIGIGGGSILRRLEAGQRIDDGQKDRQPANSQANADGSPPRKTEIDVAENASKTTRDEPLQGRNSRKENGQTAKEKFHAVAYPVAELVVPIHNFDFRIFADSSRQIQREEGPKTKEEWLIKKITQTISPESWTEFGGAGTIDYYSVGTALVVNNTARVQSRVKHMLETMRRMQEVTVVVETRVISLNARTLTGLQGLCPQLKKDEHIVLTELEMLGLLRKVEADADTKVVQAPKITMFPGQRIGVCLDPGKEFPASKNIDVKLAAHVGVDLQHIDLDLKATVGKVEFAKAVRLEDGASFAQCKRNGENMLMILLTARVMLTMEEEDVAAPESDKGPKN